MSRLIGTDRTHAVDQYDPGHPIYRGIAKLAELRKGPPALRDGVQVTRYAANGPGVFAFSRVDPAQRVEYVVADVPDGALSVAGRLPDLAFQLLTRVTGRLALELFSLATNLILHISVTQSQSKLPSNVRSP